MTVIRPTDAATPALSTEARLKRALWRASHRGIREMDVLLGNYAAARLATMTAEELARFEMLLQLPDPDLHRWIIDPASPGNGDFAAEIDTIRRFHGLPAGA